MKGNIKTHHRGLTMLAALALIMGLVGSSPGAVARASSQGSSNPNPTVLPPASKPYGMTYGQWNDKWVQWVMGLPVDPQNPEGWPLFDTTGAACGAGQSGPVWFLAGALGGFVTRSCDLPAGKAVFFPVLNGWCDSSPARHDTYEHLQACVKPTIDSAASLSAEIDGQSITNLQDYRAFTPPPNPFVETLPNNNLWQYFGCSECTAGDYDAYADGYYLMLAPLSAGAHTVHFHGELPGFGVILDVTYHLNTR